MLCSTQIANGQGTVGTMPVSTGLQVTQAAIATASSSSTSSTSSSSSSSSISGEPRAKRCKHCDDGVHSTNSTNGHSHGNGIWPVTLDHDLFTTISAVYPDWFKSSSDSLASNTSSNGHNHHHHHHRANQHHHKVPNPGRNHFQNQHLQRHHQRTAAVMAESGGGGGANATGGTQAGSPRSPDSPPKAIVDTSPLQNAMDKNKESLKVKLMLRRPINQLIAQGIMPPLKTPPAFHDQRRQLERAKTGDMLKAKIQQRPARVELERRHILEPTGAPIDPSLVERQRMLKKARLADQLNDQLSHRPGPLELIKKNILHTEEPIEQAVKAGRIPFKATCEGQVMRPQHPNSYVSLEDDSQSSEGGTGSDVIESAAKSAGIVVSLAVPVTQTQAPAAISFAELCQSVSAGLLPLAPAPTAPPAPSPAPSSSLSPLSSLASPATPQTPLTPRTQPSPTPGKDKNRKKSKLKSQPKARTIKFHEYKGPPNAQKSNLNSANAAGETSYEILLQQQQLFLQWQLEWQHKYPQIILPASQKTSSSDDMTPAGSPPSVSSNSQSEIITPIPPKPLGRLEDMKVSDLKAELKRRSLPVSGSKPQLIERLKPFTEPVTHSGHIIMDTPPPHTPAEESQEEDNKSQASPMGSDTGMEIVPESPGSMIMNDDIVQKQQKQIEELQRELTRSQMQLQQVRNGIIPTGQKLALQHHVQARQALKQQQHAAFQNAKNAANLSGGLVLNGQQAALVLNQLQLHKAKLVNGQTGTVANFLGTIPILPAVITAAAPPELVQMSRPQEDTLQVEAKSPLNNHEVIISQIPRPPPLPPSLPQFEETVVRTPDVTVTNMEKSGVKSQIVDDVLEILIKNGELPPSAANDPPTPNCDMNQTPMIHSELSQNENLPSQELSQALSDQMSQELSQALANASQNSISSQPHSPLSGLDALLMAQTPNDLKDLALDLDTLDAVDFSALDMDLDRQTNHSPMEEVEHQQKHITERHHMNEQQLDQNNQAHSGLEMHNDELMDVCTDMHMDMDEPDWLDSLMTTEANVQNANISSMPTVSCNDYISATSNPYDPLLGNNLLHDTFDLFGFSDDFRGAVTDLTTATGPPTSTMSWDKLDFAA